MKAIFMGTPDFAVPSLEALYSRHEVAAVVTQPDRPSGRGNKLKYPPVKEYALAHGLPVIQPERVKTRAFLKQLAAYNADIIVVAAFGRILTESVLNLPPHGCICVHASLLPRHRGAAPMQWSVINGDSQTGVTIMQMDKGIDTGDMILQKSLEILPEDNFGTIHDKMAELGAQSLLEAMELIESGNAVRIKQNDDLSTYAPMITKELEKINWNKNTADIINLIRGLDPFPGAYTVYDGHIIKVYGIEAYNISLSGHNECMPGEIVEVTKKGFAVKTADGVCLVTLLQPQGGKRMNAGDYLRGHKMDTGKVLD